VFELSGDDVVDKETSKDPVVALFSGPRSYLCRSGCPNFPHIVRDGRRLFETARLHPHGASGAATGGQGTWRASIKSTTASIWTGSVMGPRFLQGSDRRAKQAVPARGWEGCGGVGDVEWWESRR
jgi:hypothetical protein